MAFAPAALGYFGKLPARGDFLRAGLPEDFVAPWDGWCRDMLAASRAELGPAWQEAWMTAPIWRFLLPPGACGPRAVLGLWLPSMDRVGRHYPFLLCALAPSLDDLQDGAAWMDAAEAAGLACVVEDAPHETLPAALGAPFPPSALPALGWWTEGSPLVAPKRHDLSTLLSAADLLRDPNPAD